MRSKTEQELFWEGEFGNEYTTRNQILPEQRQPFFAQVLQKTYGVRTICELGANRGHNLQAIANLSRNFELTGVELNQVAIAELDKMPGVKAKQASIQEFETDEKFDLVFTCGVLIHINPEDLPIIYEKIYNISSRYILLNEYYNPVPVEVHYRGHTSKLFKRDFASEFLEQYKGKVSVIDNGFLWNKIHPGWDNTNWFLLERIV
ncbi:methyltransferase domain-containing protein [Calothrix sp. FACHB-1219]|uniref:pseudaminic acid biosynthesis-associated methylase n=1 Tax=unclassified Calothrix TaxID=2619626 RepID=UPI001687FF63|nr:MULTISPECIES: pseudaminic acid biosynthesis-associated methylase [unclassified Calothrix]MBD2201237.1 methyltransferase domain-containing protein [Calothrix sp. FACHB-168]MBD2215671.1 methyltransferase domain-containing protein [Calothrix sp. FACHB-1219]